MAASPQLLTWEELSCSQNSSAPRGSVPPALLTAPDIMKFSPLLHNFYAQISHSLRCPYSISTSKLQNSFPWISRPATNPTRPPSAFGLLFLNNIQNTAKLISASVHPVSQSTWTATVITTKLLLLGSRPQHPQLHFKPHSAEKYKEG